MNLMGVWGVPVSTAVFPVGIQGVSNVAAMFQWQFIMYQV